ncbi:hypothetical protein CERZMDRAFT_99332 [Cercospora zeae-maydis SCOH1-5]|uniref:Uncharacterized protein n=1 Tax=Cercospora zeae-maydis SCOH1-5 TaxID=717836 RepID=A0A6A6FBM5_9PEZI|nr:hypothetical protein CERZMDRAFT_99332 [Cercospora zeae-maydis SCOH1-5]
MSSTSQNPGSPVDFPEYYEELFGIDPFQLPPPGIPELPQEGSLQETLDLFGLNPSLAGDEQPPLSGAIQPPPPPRTGRSRQRRTTPRPPVIYASPVSYLRVSRYPRNETRGPLDHPDDSDSDREMPRRIIQVAVPNRQGPSSSSSTRRNPREERRRLHAATLQVLYHEQQLSWEGRMALEEVMVQNGFTYGEISEEDILAIRAQARAVNPSQRSGRQRPSMHRPTARTRQVGGERGRTLTLGDPSRTRSRENEQEERTLGEGSGWSAEQN